MGEKEKAAIAASAPRRDSLGRKASPGRPVKKRGFKLLCKADAAPEVVDAINDYCEETGIPRTVVVRQALDLWLETYYPEDDTEGGI